MFVITRKKIFLLISALVVAGSILSALLLGLNLGIDFTGGSLLEVAYQKLDTSADIAKIRENIDALDFGAYTLQPTEEQGYIIKLRTITDAERLLLLDAFSISGQYSVNEERFTSIGPTVGQELKQKAFVGMIGVFAMIILFIAWAFRKVSRPISSWKYGIVAILTLLHDVLVPVGIFAILGHFYGVEIDILFVTALLAIVGYSVNDTIVVFDRIRENLEQSYKSKNKIDFGEIVGNSINQTLVRSINTSFTTVLVLVALLIFSHGAIEYFALALTIGVVAGTYSSIFLASPLLVFIHDKFKHN
jgi:preprotein translocase subunit SecF